MTLTDKHHFMLLRDSAIDPEVMKARGYQSVAQAAAIQALGFSEKQARTAPALAFPLWDVHGKQHGWQIRPDKPRQDQEGKDIKYETPLGGRVSLDVHPSVQRYLKNPSVPLWITEGVKKGDSLVSKGACTIALMGGVWGFRGTRADGTKGILEDWDHVELNGRLVYIVFDSDIYTKPNVAQALTELSGYLRHRHAEPYLVAWPDAYRQTKIGVGDFFAQGHELVEVFAMVQPLDLLSTTAYASRNGLPLAAPPPPQHPARASVASADPNLPLSDTTNALALVRNHGQDLRYCFPWKSWLVHSSTHWERDTSGAVMRLAKQTIKAMLRHVDPNDDDAKVKAVMAHIKSSLSTAKLRAMVENAQSEEGIAVQPEDLDADPWLLNVQNGTLDLHTGRLRPHDRNDLITKCLPIAYDVNASCPTWMQFLWQIMGGSQGDDSPDMSAGELENRRTADARAERLMTFLQRASGYSLTGDTREQCLFLLHGSGTNGKSTFLETLQALLGDYAQSTPSASLLAKKEDDPIRNDLARFRGARLITAVEIGEGKRLNEELVKRLTGQDTVTARFLYAEFFDFQATHKLFIACNHLPQIRGQDHAIWRRIRRIPFLVTIPEDEQDKDLPAKLRAELPGILAWAVQGCLDWQREGLGTPEEVRAATQEYKDSMDMLGQFITECCLVGANYQAETPTLYDAYKHWCVENREEPITLRKFGQDLTDRNYTTHKSNGKHWRLGIALPHKPTA